MQKFGYIHDPPKATDFSFTQKLAPVLAGSSLGDVDLSGHTTPTNQYSAGSCVGCATADAVEVLNSIQGLPHVQLSRLFVYSMARNLVDLDGDGKGDVDRDDGTFIRVAFDVISKFGICREDVPVERGGWPYDLNKLHTLPSLRAMRAAAGCRIHSYYRIMEPGSARLDAVLRALRGGHPVVFGTQVDQAFMDLRDGHPVSIPKGKSLGGHAMLVCGYVTGKGFIVKNSWGSNWGDGGFCIMRPEWLTWKGTRDLWVPTKGVEFHGT